MRAGIVVIVTPEDRRRLEAVVRDRNRPQKHVWRARIILLTADGLGTNGIVRATGKDKTVVWRWQERFMHEGVDGLLRDKTRPPGKPPLPPEAVARLLALTGTDPPAETPSSARFRPANSCMSFSTTTPPTSTPKSVPGSTATRASSSTSPRPRAPGSTRSRASSQSSQNAA
jgi:hypothetical protein